MADRQHHLIGPAVPFPAKLAGLKLATFIRD
jgi:hypothetical protein